MRSRLRNWDSKISFFVFADIITGVSGILIFVTLLLATNLGRPAANVSESVDPQIEQQLQEALRQQTEADARNRRLQELLAASETAPAVEKLEDDVAQLRSRLADTRQQQSALTARLAGSQADIQARDRALGLVALKAKIETAVQETESTANQEAKARVAMANLEQHVARAQSQALKARQREGQLWLIPDKTATTKEPILVTVSGSGIIIERFDRPDQRKQFDKSNADSAFETFLREARALDQYVVFLVRPSGIELFQDLAKSARSRGFDVGFDALEEGRQIHFSTPPPADDTAPTSETSPAVVNPRPAVATNPVAPVIPSPASVPQINSNTSSSTPQLPPTPKQSKNWWRRLLERIGLS